MSRASVRVPRGQRSIRPGTTTAVFLEQRSSRVRTPGVRKWGCAMPDRTLLGRNLPDRPARRSLRCPRRRRGAPAVSRRPAALRLPGRRSASPAYCPHLQAGHPLRRRAATEMVPTGVNHGRLSSACSAGGTSRILLRNMIGDTLSPIPRTGMRPGLELRHERIHDHTERSETCGA